MTLLHPYIGTETKAKQPINETLMDLKVRENLENIDTRLVVVETAGTGGGASDPKENFADIIAGGGDDVGILWRRRFSLFESTLTNGANKEGADYESNSRNDRIIFMQDNANLIARDAFGGHYNGEFLRFSKDAEILLKLKKGENFFSLNFGLDSANTDNITILIDGQTPTSLGLVDENGNAALDIINTNGTPVRTALSVFYFGLNGEEHIISFKNTDSATKDGVIDYYEVGHRSENPTIDHSININSGKARVAGTEIVFSEGKHTFTAPTKGNANGYTGMLKIDTAGLVTPITGQSPAMTQIKADINTAFSGAVTSLAIKSNWYFPDNGICLLSTGYGAHHLFSYNGKTDASVQAMTLDNILWQSKPTQDMVAEVISAGGGVAANKPSININLWGSAPILIDSSNNKIDFQITVNGVTTLHVATIANGRYAADILHLETAVIEAMNTAKSIVGKYFCRYNPQAQLWSIGVEGLEETRIDFLFSTGVNAANTFGAVVGISADSTTKKTYTATTARQHLCARVFIPDERFINPEDTKFKYNFVSSGIPVDTNFNDPIKDALSRMGFSSVRHFDAAAGQLVEFYPDVDANGISFSFLSLLHGTMLTVIIDNEQPIYINHSGSGETHDEDNLRARVMNFFVSFPKGSKVIKILSETDTEFQLTGSPAKISFLGARQYYTKPKWEELTTEEKILKVYEIAPLSLYATDYGNQSASLYSPSATDNLDTITETGSWASTTWQAFNNFTRDTSANGAYVDIEFTLSGDGGGIAFRTAIQVSNTGKVNYYLNTQAAGITEGTDLIGSFSNRHSSGLFDQLRAHVMGLPAESYILRVKNVDTSRLINQGYRVIDTVLPEENKNVNADVTNNFQAISYPYHSIKYNLAVDDGHVAADFLLRTGFKEGKDIHVDHAIVTLLVNQGTDSAALLDLLDLYYSHSRYDNNQDKMRSFKFCKSAYIITDFWHVSSSNVGILIDGRTTVNNHNHQTQTKGGSAPAAARRSHSAAASKIFRLTCAFSAGNTYTLSDTRGLKNGDKVILYDGTNEETFTIENLVSDTSFDTVQTPATIIPVNVTEVRFYGFHSMIIRNNINGEAFVSAFCFEPLPIRPSLLKRLLTRKKKLEHVSVNFRQVGSGDDLYYPTHSDGVAGDWGSSEISVTSKTSGGAAFGIDQDLRDVQIDAGTIDVKIKSTREVYEEIDNMEKF